MTSETLWEALQRQRRMMALNGELDLSNVTTEDLSSLGSQKALKTLKLVQSQLTTLHTLPSQPLMKSIIADNSRIETLGGLANQPRLAQISFKDTPLSEQENFRLAAIICIGPRLSKINGQPVTQSERRMANCYPPIAKYLVASGWVVQYPPPSKQDFRYLADQFSVPYTDEDLESSQPIVPASPPSSPRKGDSQSQSQSQTQQSFGNQIASILRPLGFAIRCGPEMNDDIINAVSRICEVITKIDELNQEEEEHNEEHQEDPAIEEQNE